MPVLGLLPTPYQQFLDGNGRPLAGGSVTIYLQGTTSFATTWADPFGNTPNANPLFLDANGCPDNSSGQIWGAGDYTLVVQDPFGVTQEQGPVTVLAVSPAMQTVLGEDTTAEAAAALGLAEGLIIPATATISGTALALTRAAGTNQAPAVLGTSFVFVAPSAAAGPFTLGVPGDDLAAAPLQDSTGNTISSLNAQQLCVVTWNPATSAWVLLFAPQTPATVFPFSASGTWVCPTGVNSVLCSGTGGGGAGGSGQDGFSGGGGGGAAQTIQAQTVSVTPGVTYQVQVGAGGVAVVGAAGGNGTPTTFISSTFQTLTSLAGGLGGAFGNTTATMGGANVPGGAAGGPGGSAGTSGYWISNDHLSFGGNGGSTLTGAGAAGSLSSGYAPAAPGCGGSGGAGGVAPGNIGGNGAPGNFLIQVP